MMSTYTHTDPPPGLPTPYLPTPCMSYNNYHHYATVVVKY